MPYNIYQEDAQKTVTMLSFEKIIIKVFFFFFFFATKSLCDVRAVIIRWMHSERFSCAQAASSSKPQRAGRVSENTEQKDTSAGEL